MLGPENLDSLGTPDISLKGSRFLGNSEGLLSLGEYEFLLKLLKSTYIPEIKECLIGISPN